MKSQPLWQPSEEQIQNSSLYRFQQLVNYRFNLDLKDYFELHQWSIRSPAPFWSILSEFVQIKWRKIGFEVFRAPPRHMHPMMDAEWFPDYELNFAENLLPPPDEQIWVISSAEGRPERVELNGLELNRLVARCARGLVQMGVKKGDRVAGIAANTAETIVAMLATTSLGAVWTSCSPDFGVSAIVERFGQVEPKVIFASLAYQYHGKLFDCRSKLDQVLNNLSTIEYCVGIDHLHQELEWANKDRKGVSFHSWLEQQSLPGVDDWQVSFTPTTFNHPLYIMYSSGTTGVPKCIVHGVGGTLLQHKKELVLHCNLQPGRPILYFTTCGWMMWNWMVSALSVGSPLVLYEGSVSYPNLSQLWQLAAATKVQVFGTSPKFLASCQQEGLIPKTQFDLSALEVLLSTGSPLLPEQFDWVYQNVSKKVHLASISGGTDIISCFVLGVPTLPVYRGEIQGPGLGMAVDCWNDAGESIRGEKGELVCHQPFPSAPLGLWGDEHKTRYRATYFDHFENSNVWRHGDFIEIRESGGVVIHGRSDATLNPGGIRIGTAEIYRQVESLEDVADSIVVDSHHGGNDLVILFVKLKGMSILDDEKIQFIKRRIREILSPRHVPWGIFQVQDIPYTRSGKKLELAVKAALLAKDIRNQSAIANPECLEEYHRLGELIRKTTN